MHFVWFGKKQQRGFITGSLMLAPQPCFWSYLGFIPKADLRDKGFYLRGFFGRHRNRGFYLL